MRSIDDSYGSVLREHLKESMSEPWIPKNKRSPREPVFHWIIGVLAAVFALATVISQIIKVKGTP